MSTNAEIVDKLRDKVLFKEFTDLEMEEFISLSEERSAPAGATIVMQDELGDCMYIVVKGQARVVHHRDSHHIELARLKDGDFFGELSLVDHGPRSADVLAVDDCTLLRVDIGAVSALAGVYPNAAFKFLIAIGRILVDRLRYSNQRYIDSLLFPHVGKD